MKVNVAGAGAGKTTSMASRIKECTVPNGKILFCVAFTNAAVKNICKKVQEEYGRIPDYIRISTIHSFLYQELIQPYYFLLYGEHYKAVSVIDLPVKDSFKNKKITELKAKGYLHQTKIPETAKWVAYKKSTDRAVTKKVREYILENFALYCYKIFVDEAQDIDKDMKTILSALDGTGVDIELFGDPKQDIRGYGQFRALIDVGIDVNYIQECHRCPQKHLQLSNLLAPDTEKQVADAKNKAGRIFLYFETEIDDMEGFIERGGYGLKYIQKKNDRFATHDVDEHDERFSLLNHEILEALLVKWKDKKTEMAINRAAYYMTEKMFQDYDAGTEIGKVINRWISNGTIDYDSTIYAKICQALGERKCNINSGVIVSSIAIIKGLEDNSCLFILTEELAPYLFGDKVEEKATKHLLYVALTRSRNDLSILITREVEENYTREYIKAYLENITEIEELE